MGIIGLGPHGERAAPPERVILLPNDITLARRKRFRVVIVMHTLESDWSKQLVQGIIGTLGDAGAIVVEVVDCGFSAEAQIHALKRIRLMQLDCVISLPITSEAVAEAHSMIAATGTRLVLVDNVPSGLLPFKDYASLVSADNYGLGMMAAEMLAEHVPKNGRVALLGYDKEFFATNEREISFSRWISTKRPDITTDIFHFDSLRTVGKLANDLLTQPFRPSGVFVVWDTPCVEVLKVMNQIGIYVPTTTIDLGSEVASSLAQDGPVKGIAAQRPFQQGESVGKTTVTDLLGRKCPEWIALPGLAVRQSNVAESYQAIWRMPAPRAILEGLAPR